MPIRLTPSCESPAPMPIPTVTGRNARPASQRREAEHALDVERVEEEHREEPRGDEQHRDVGGADRAHAEDVEADERRALPLLDQDEGREQDQPRRRRSRSCWRDVQPDCLHVDDPVDERDQAGGDGDGSGHVEDPVLARPRATRARSRSESTKAAMPDGDVDEEDPRPGEVLDEDAAEEQPDRGAAGGDRRPRRPSPSCAAGPRRRSSSGSRAPPAPRARRRGPAGRGRGSATPTSPRARSGARRRVKMTRPARKTRLRPSMSPARPPSSRKPPKISVYELTIHCRSASATSRSSWIDGSATFTIVASRMTMNCAMQTRQRTSQGLVLRPGTLRFYQTAALGYGSAYVVKEAQLDPGGAAQDARRLHVLLPRLRLGLALLPRGRGRAPGACPHCGGETRHRCPACSAPFPSAFAVECEECGAAVRPPEVLGVRIRKPGR